MNYEQIEHFDLDILDDPRYGFTDAEKRAFRLRKQGVPPIAIQARLGRAESSIRSCWKRMKEKIDRVESEEKSVA